MQAAVAAAQAWDVRGNDITTRCLAIAAARGGATNPPVEAPTLPELCSVLEDATALQLKAERFPVLSLLRSRTHSWVQRSEGLLQGSTASLPGPLDIEAAIAAGVNLGLSLPQLDELQQRMAVVLEWKTAVGNILSQPAHRSQVRPL